MKINFICIGLFRSGGMRVIFEYANRLQRLGHDVIYYYPLIPYKFKNEKNTLLAKKFYWSIKDAFVNKKNSTYEIFDHEFRIKPVCKINGFFVRNADVTVATTWPTVFSVNKLASKKGKKVHLVQDYEVWNSNVNNVDKSLTLNLKRITVSNWLSEFFKARFDTESEVILNGINFEIFHNNKKHYDRLKTITFMDHALVQKGVKNAIETIELLHSKYNNLRFLCFGFKSYSNLPEYVEFIQNPVDSKIADIYRRTDIFLYTSLYEGFALPPAEAMACGCAVVTTKVGAVQEYSVHNESAIHAEPGNIGELFNGVCYLLDNDGEIARISKNAYYYIRQKLNWDESVKKFENVLLRA